MNTNYAKLNADGTVEYAPDSFWDGDTFHCAPSAVAYAAAGWMPVEREPPECGGGQYAALTGWEARDGAVRAVYEVRDVEEETETEETETATTPATVYRRWTPLAIKRACGESWAGVKSALEAAGLWDDFVMAQYIDEADESFAGGYAQACAAFGREAVDAILGAAEQEAR